MNTLKKNLEQRDQPELIAIIQHLLRQEPDLQWLLMTHCQPPQLGSPLLIQRCTASRF